MHLSRRQLVVTGLATLAPAPAAESPLALGHRRELFVDSFLIEKLAGAELRLGAPIDTGSAFAFDRPWEGRFCNYVTVIPDGDLVRLY